MARQRSPDRVPAILLKAPSLAAANQFPEEILDVA
jgi:hypothetical protein